VASLHDDPELRDAVEAAAPSALALLRRVWSLPHTAPAGWRESEQPKGGDEVQLALASRAGALLVVSARADAPVRAVAEEAARARGLGALEPLAAGRLWEEAPPRGAPSPLAPGDVPLPLRRNGLWALETPASAAAALHEAEAAAAAAAAQVLAVRAGRPERPLLAAVAEERAEGARARVVALRARARAAASGEGALRMLPVAGAPGAGASLRDPADPFDEEPRAGVAVEGPRGRPAQALARRAFLEPGEAQRARARLAASEARAYVRGPGEARLAQAYMQAGVERFPKKAVTWEDVWGGGGAEADAKAVAAAEGRAA